MLQAMMSAETGDDVYGEDPTVNGLESLAANMTGKEAGLYVSSGTQGNLLALLSHCERGEEYIAGQDAHTYKFEAGGGAVLGGIQPQPLPFNVSGELDLALVESVIKPDDFHFARTKLICLENTQAGKPLSIDYQRAASDLACKHGLKLHLDGARVFNAAVKQDVPVSDITRYYDTVSICLSKGLAAPVGSVLVGDKQTIDRARRWRKMLGGGMRQAGILAAAGVYALQHNVARLAKDHQHAILLAEALQQLPSFNRTPDPETNMVLLAVSADRFKQLRSYLAENDVTVSAPRLVLHKDVGSDDIESLINLFRQFDQ
jgi:threonine aldolase